MAKAEWLVRVVNRSGKAAAGLHLKFRPFSQKLAVNPSRDARISGARDSEVHFVPGADGDTFVLKCIGSSVAPDQEVSFSILSSAPSMEFENGFWIEEASSTLMGGKIEAKDVYLAQYRGQPKPTDPDRRRPFIGKPTVWIVAGLLMTVFASAYYLAKPSAIHSKPVSVPFKDSGLESRLTYALNADPLLGHLGTGSGPRDPDPWPDVLSMKKNAKLANAIADAMRKFPAEYNKPSALLPASQHRFNS